MIASWHKNYCLPCVYVDISESGRCFGVRIARPPPPLSSTHQILGVFPVKSSDHLAPDVLETRPPSQGNLHAEPELRIYLNTVKNHAQFTCC